MISSLFIYIGELHCTPPYHTNTIITIESIYLLCTSFLIKLIIALNVYVTPAIKFYRYRYCLMRSTTGLTGLFSQK